MFILPGKAQPAQAKPPPDKRPLLERRDLPRSQQDQFDDLLHLVWTLEAWWRTEDHIDHLVEGESG